MPKPWSEVASSDGFKSLPPEQQDGARRQYFDDVVAPRVPTEHRDMAWEQFSADTGVGRRALPAGVAPSTAGAGRGRVNPGDQFPVSSQPSGAPAAPDVALQDPFGGGDGASIMQVAQPKRESVLEGIQLTPPQFDPAEAERLSRRDYAEIHPFPGDPRYGAPSMRASDPREAPSLATTRGAALQDASFPVRATAKAISGAAQGVGGALRAAGDFTGIDALKAAGGATAQGAEQFEKGMGTQGRVEGFGPKSPVPYLANMAEGAASSLAQSAAYASVFGPRAVIPLMSVMTAGEEYDKARNSGLTPAMALAGALPKGAFEAIGEKFTGLDKVAGAMGTLLTKGATAEAKKGAAEILIKSGIKEVPGEVITYLGQTGVDLLPGIGLNPNLTMGQFVDGLRDTVVQAGMMGGAMGAGGVTVRTDPRIKRLRDAGETGVADLLQSKLDKQNTAASVEGELGGMAPLAEFAQKPEFQAGYRQLRTEGVKPVEAAGRSALTSSFRTLAASTGLSEKAMNAALEGAKKIGLDKLPGFFQRYTQSLAAKGVIQPVEGVDALGGELEATRDHAMNAAMGAVYQPEPRAAVEAKPDAVQAVDNIDRILNPAPGATQAARPSVEEAAHEAATSPLNDLPQPTEAQKEAGNYKVGRVSLHGLNISIENPKGSERSGTSPDGTKWNNTLEAHYGYIRKTMGADGDHVDAFIGPHPQSEKVFVVDQIDQKTGAFDETKVMLGYPSLEAAIQGYSDNFAPGWKVGRVTPMTVDGLKTWLRSDESSGPASKESNGSETRNGGARAEPQPTLQDLAQRQGQVQQPEQSVLPQLRGTGNKNVPGVGAELSSVPDGSGKAPESTAHPGSNQERVAISAGKSALGNKDGTGKQSAQKRYADTQRKNADAGAMGSGNRDGSLSPSLPDQQGWNDGSASAGNTSSNTGTEQEIEPTHFGRDNVSLAEGGKAFKTRTGADQARKLQPMMRVVRAPGGFALTEKTTAQLAAQDKAAARLRNPQTSARGEPIPAHAFIASEGGLSQLVRSDLGVEGNPRIGNRTLYAGAGRGMSIDQATEKLVQEGYLREGAGHNEAFDLIRRSLTKPQYTPDGTERMAAAELEARMMAQQEAVADVEPLSDNQAEEIDDADIPWGAAVSNVSEAEAMRSMGFTEQEIEDATAKRPGIASPDSQGGGVVDARATTPAPADLGSREGAPGEDSRRGSDPRRQTAQVTQTKTPAPAGVSVSGLSITKRADGTLAVKGDPQAIREALSDIPARSLTPMKGGILVGRTQADKALAVLQPTELTSPTRDEVVQQQDRADQAAKDKERADRAADKQARAEDDRKRIAKASESAADSFELGGDALDNLTGQQSIFEPKAKYNTKNAIASEPQADYTGHYETDLFGDPLPAAAGKDRAARSDGKRVHGNLQPTRAVSDTEQPRGEYYVNTIVGAESSREVGAARIVTPEHAAQATSYLYKSAVERLDGIVTDKHYKPIAVIGGFKGAVGQTSVYPATLMGEAIRIPGAAHVWFSHNHPSGQSLLSRADEAMNKTLSDVFRGSGIEPMGLLAIAGDRYTYVDSHGEVRSERSIPPSTTRKTVPVMTRELVDGKARGDVISSPDAAKAFAKTFYGKASEPGVMLLNSQNAVVGWLPISKDMLGPLRDTGGAASVYRAVSQSNAASAIIVHGGELDALVRGESVTASQNIAAALKLIDTRPLDSINVKTGESAAERGLDVSSGPMFARSPGFNAAVDDAIAAGMKGEKPGRQPVSIGTTTPALRAAGLADGELRTSPTILAKAVFDHGVTKTLLKKIPDLLETPVMVLTSDTVDKSFVVVTSELVGGKPLLVVISPEVTRGNVAFNFVPSVYPKDDLGAIQRWIDSGKLKYIDKKQSPLWFGSTRLKLPGEYLTAKGLQTRNIATNEDIVKESGAGLARQFDAEAFRRAFMPPSTMSVSDVQKAVDALAAKWTDGPNIKVVETPADLPVAAPRDARGFVHGDTAYIVANNHQTRDGIARTLGHEAIGHYGLWRMLGDDGVRQFERNLQLAIKSGNIPLNKLSRKVRGMYVDEKGAFNLTPGEEAREIAAFAVEDAIDPVTGEFKPGFGFVKAVYAKVAEFLRGIGIDVKFTNAELHGMLVSAMRGLEAGKRVQGGADVMVAAAREGSGVKPESVAQQSADPDTGLPQYAGSRGLFIGFAAPTERLEFIPTSDDQQMLNFVIMRDGRMIGSADLLFERGKLSALYDIEVDKEGRGKGDGAAVIQTLLAADPSRDVQISNIVESARGFWESVGIPQQNRGPGEAYDGNLNWETFTDSRAARRAAHRDDGESAGTVPGTDAPATGAGQKGDGQTGQLARGASTATPTGGGPATPMRTSAWRDATGRIQFAPGAWLYDKLGTMAHPLLVKLQLNQASPELKRQIRQMKLEVQKAQETAVAVAKEANKLSTEERRMVSDIIEKELATGIAPPSHAVKLAATMTTAMSAQSAELVRLGMLTEEAAARWDGAYLPRFYESKLAGKVQDAWANALGALRGRTSAMQGIKGKSLKGRGLYEVVPAAELANYEALGWEKRDPDFDPAVNAEVQVWRDYTPTERQKMGEIRDAGFRFVLGYMQTQKDVALGRMFEGMADTMASRLDKPGYVRVPDTKVQGTGASRYGKLAGLYIPQEVMTHLSQVDESANQSLALYRKAMGLWKEGKTVLNPVSHVNNIVSNLSMAHFGGVSYHRADKYLAAMKDFATKSAALMEAKEAGLFLGTMSEAELLNTLPPELQALAKQADSTAARGVKWVYNAMSYFLRRPMGIAYQAEDTFFRYLLYKEARGRGMPANDAVDYAQRYIFTYDDLPKGARMVRDFAVPFFAYTYKAVPALLHTALTYPHRFAAPAAVLWMANAAAYAIAAGSDDDDSWQEALRKYLTDDAFRAKVREKEKLEREHLPPWMKGTTSLMSPKAIRLGMDELTKLPLFIDVSRIVPGGDIFDVSPNAGGLPIPQPITPSHPLFTTAVAMLGNKDLFFGKDIVDSNDTRGEATEKRSKWLWQQVMPAITAGNYHWDRTMNAIAQASGGEIKWLPEDLAEKYTGVGRDGLPVQPKLAAAQTFGIKVRPIDLEKSADISEGQTKKMISQIEAEMRSLRRLNDMGAISDRVYDKADDLAYEKKNRLRDGMTVDGDEKK